MLRVAADLILQEGVLPLSMPKFGEAAQVSKGLIYSYFPTQYDLFNTLLRDRFAILEAAGIVAASKQKDFRSAARACASIYFHHVAAHGPVIHIVSRDLFMSGKFDPDVRRLPYGVAGRLARLARAKLRLNAREAIAAFTLVMAIPEDCGRMVFQGELPLDRADLLCTMLVDSALAALS